MQSLVITSSLNIYHAFAHHNIVTPQIKAKPFKHQPHKWSNTLKQFVRKLPTNCLSVFDDFAGLAFNG